MREIYIKSKAGLLSIGRRGENLATRVHLAEVPESGQAVTVYVLRNGDSASYPASQVEITDTEIVWTVTSVDTDKSGRGKVQYRFSDATTGEVIKTEIYGFVVGLAIDTEVGPAPDPYETWLDSLTELAGQAQTAAREAEDYAESASASAEQAEAEATRAAESAEEASQSEQTASASAQSAEVAKTAAQTAEASAQGFAQTASAKAQDASGYAQTATQKATESAQSATTASNKATEASGYATASQTAQGLAESARDLAQGYAEDAQGYAEDAQASAESISASASQIAKNSADILKAFPTDTASGAIASFSDGADDLPLKSLVVDINPVQDLHGQSSPYPAGGGKNKLRFPYAIGSGRTVNGITATVSSDGIVTLNGTATAQAEFPLIATYIDLPAGTYTLSGLPSGGSATTLVYNAFAFDENDTILFDYRITSSRTVTVNNPIKRMYIYIRVAEGYTANNLVVKPQFEEGSSVTDYAPYENICPISGWTGMTINANGTEITISWESEAGTVYGGTLDVVSGALTVTKGFIQSYSGEILPSAWISDRDVYADGTTPTTGAEVCYTLAEPVTYQLTPHEVKSLLGQNNIWADTGDTSLAYRADTKLYIDGVYEEYQDDLADYADALAALG